MSPVPSSTYRALLSRPGARQFAVAGLLARLPMSTVGISTTLMVQIQYGKWEIAGRVAAIGVLVWALQTMPTARLIDRKGQRMMAPLAALFVLGVLILGVTAMMRGPEWLLWVGAAISSVSGPVGSLTRARWSHILDNDDEIHTAFSLEGALDEVLFVAGPSLATVLAYAVHPTSGLALAVVANVVGLTLLLRERRTEPPARGDEPGQGLGRKVPAGVIATAFIALALGAMFGAFDISTVAFAKESGHGWAGGVVLGIISAGSFVGGLAYGARKWKTPLWKRLLVGAVLVGLGFASLALMPNLVSFAAVGFVVGMTIAPAITAQDSVAQRLVPQTQLIEGMAWLRIGLGGGVAVGGWLSGRLIDQDGFRAGLHVMAASAIAVAVFALAGIWWIRRDTLAASAAGVADVPPAPGGPHGEQQPTLPVV